MAGKTFLPLVKRECKRILHDKASLFILFIGPLLAFFLVSYIFSAGVPRDLPVAIVDDDHSALSRKIARLSEATAIASIDRSYISLAEARDAIEEGRIDAVLYIPAATEKHILRSEPASIALYVNNANVIKGSLLGSNIQKAIRTVSAGIRLQARLARGATREQAIAQVMPVRVNSSVLFNPFISYAYFITLILLPVMLTIFVFFGTVYAIGTELQYGTAGNWLMQANNSINVALVAKLLPYTITYFAMACCMNLTLFYFLGVPLQGNTGALLVSELLLILSYQSMAIVYVALTKNMRLALSLGSAYTMLAVTYAGFTYPAFGMPGAAQVLGRLFPVSYWIPVLSGQSLRTEPVTNAYTGMLWLCGFIVFGCLFIPRLKYVLANEKYWGKI